MVARDLGVAVAGDELRRVRGAVALVEQVEVGSGGDRVALVDDGGVHPGGQHVGAAGVGGRGDVTVGGHQLGEPGRRAHAVQGGHVRIERL